ncbi:MAG: hypothetical protein ACK4YM_08465 [Novosphingobium sp.]
MNRPHRLPPRAGAGLALLICPVLLLAGCSGRDPAPAENIAEIEAAAQRAEKAAERAEAAARRASNAPAAPVVEVEPEVVDTENRGSSDLTDPQPEAEIKD